MAGHDLDHGYVVKTTGRKESGLACDAFPDGIVRCGNERQIDNWTWYDVLP